MQQSHRIKVASVRREWQTEMLPKPRIANLLRVRLRNEDQETA